VRHGRGVEQVRPHVLREYALLADGERGALIGPEGHVAWMCAPRWHSEPVFAGLVGGSGVYQVVPSDRWSLWSGNYEPGTLVWRCQWIVRNTVVQVREALALPGDPHTLVLLRQVLGGDRRTGMTVGLRPAAGFDGAGSTELRCRDGVWTGRVGARYWRWSGAADARPVSGDTGLEMVLDVPAHARHDLVLEISDRPFSGPPADPERAWQATEAAWASEVPDFGDTIAPGDAQHAYAVLRGLTGRGGAMVAAATTSLPERARAGANYDYRYAWIRDQCWVGQAVAAHGPHALLGDAVEFVSERLLADGPRLRPAYTVTGDQVPRERVLRLPGYPGGRDVIGNKVTDQFQLDAFGEALLLFAAAARHDRLDSSGWRAAETAVAAIEARWADADAGVWELDDRRWVHSRLTCVAGLRAMAAVATRQTATRWRERADALLAEVVRDAGVHPDGRWRRAPDDDRVDASLLLAAVRGAVPADDPRSVATWRAVQDDLARDGYVYRFRHGDRPLTAAEGAFLACGFVMALASHQQGDTADALRWFERNRSACGPPGLFAEEYDVLQRQLRGNLPQAFVHGLMLESATRLARPW
jgi:hypothetical protein